MKSGSSGAVSQRVLAMTTTTPPPSPVRFVGAEPWLPWPLSAWRWWTEPVAAERLAALRIGVALFLFMDILWTYLPNLDTFFLDGGPGGSRVFGWYTQAPRWTWSILRGLSDPLIYTLISIGWLGTTLGIVFDWLARSSAMIGWKWRIAWLTLGIALIGSSWGRAWDSSASENLFWLAPSVVAATALAALFVETLYAVVGSAMKPALIMAAVTLGCAAVLLAIGGMLASQSLDLPFLRSLVRSWQGDSDLLRAAGLIWATATALLAVGWQTRTAAITTWVLSTSFANLNPNIDNAGDVIRGIILFYLMLCPCGAVWSLDRCWQRWRSREPEVLERANVATDHAMSAPAGASGPARTDGRAGECLVISPWALRLLFIQLVFIYFMNGLYKLGGDSWMNGDSLHYVLGDVTLTRFSYAQFPLPLWLTRISTWAVLTWEVSFPLLVCCRWTRTPALVFGVLFHVGIYVSMELGNFVPYILTMYLPLLPWERLGRRARQLAT